MQFKIVFVSQRLASGGEISEALSNASCQLLEEENDLRNRLHFHEYYGYTREYLESKLKEIQKAREIIEALESPTVLPI